MKKKGQVTITIVIGLMCFVFTTVVFIQFKTVGQTNLSELELMREEELKAEKTEIKTKYDELLAKLQETNSKITEYEETIKNGQEASELLQAELEQSRALLGKDDVTGEGVIVTLEDNNMTKIMAEDLLELLNQLKQSGAEAISINDKRIVYDSYVVDINNTYISVNGERIVSPYKVKAIGDSTYLESGLSQKKYGYIDVKTTNGKSVKLETSEKITIYKYKKDLSFEYVIEEEN